MAVRNFEVGKWYLLKTDPDPAQWRDNNCGWDRSFDGLLTGRPRRCLKVAPSQTGQFQTDDPARTPTLWVSPTWDVHEVPAEEPDKPVIGASYRVIDDSDWGGWSSVMMGKRVGEVGVCTGYPDDGSPTRAKDGHFRAYLTFPDDTEGTARFFFRSGYLARVDAVAVTPGACKCSLSTGCRCGAFEAEMKAKGRKFNSALRVWMEK